MLGHIKKMIAILKTGNGLFFDPEEEKWWAVIDGEGYPFGKHRPTAPMGIMIDSCIAMPYSPKRLKFVSNLGAI